MPASKDRRSATRDKRLRVARAPSNVLSRQRLDRWPCSCPFALRLLRSRSGADSTRHGLPHLSSVHRARPRPSPSVPASGPSHHRRHGAHGDAGARMHLAHERATRLFIAPDPHEPDNLQRGLLHRAAHRPPLPPGATSAALFPAASGYDARGPPAQTWDWWRRTPRVVSGCRVVATFHSWFAGSAALPVRRPLQRRLDRHPPIWP